MRNSAFHVIDNTILQTDRGSSPLTCTPEHSRIRSGEECDGEAGDCRARVCTVDRVSKQVAPMPLHPPSALFPSLPENSIQIDAHRSDPSVSQGKTLKLFQVA